MWVLLFLLLCGAVGCAERGGQVTLTKLSDGQRFSQVFHEAYATRSAQGDWDIVMVHDGLQEAQRRRPDDAIAIAERVPVQHVVRLHVFWRPTRSARGDEPAQSNASVDWYVITPGAREGEDLLKYNGAGYVGVYPGDKRATVVMRNVRLQREILRGAMSDPVGEASLSGEVRAMLDRRYVHNALEELERLQSPAVAVDQEGNR